MGIVWDSINGTPRPGMAPSFRRLPWLAIILAALVTLIYVAAGFAAGALLL